MPTRRQFTSTLLALATTPLHAQKVLPALDARKHGARADGLTLDTPALQSAIDTTSRAGGGTVLLPPGDYLTGTLLLKSGVTLHLAAGATLLGSLAAADYQAIDPFTDGVDQVRGYALIGALDAHNIALTGPGIGTSAIDGRGPQLQQQSGKTPAARPFLVRFVRSSGILVQGLHLRNSAAWTMHLFQCSDARLEDLDLHARGLPNNDGIDIDSSTHIRVTRCTIDSGDDAICLKTTSPRPTTDIDVSHCTLSTACAAFKIGTETLGDFARITFRDSHVLAANLAAIKLTSVDGAQLSEILAENITVDSADTPIFLRLGARLKTFRPGDLPRPIGSIAAVTLRNITVAHATRIGILLAGLPSHPIHDLTLTNIHITLANTPAPITPEPDEKPAAYPEIRMFGPTLPASSLYARHVTSLHLAGVTITPTLPDPRPATLLTDITSFTQS